MDSYTKHMKFILLCILLLPAALWADSKQDVLHFGVSISTSAQREAFYTMARKFEAPILFKSQWSYQFRNRLQGPSTYGKDRKNKKSKQTDHINF